MARPTLHMLIGVPCSGKSTWVDKVVQGPNVYVASTDNLIEAHAQLHGKKYNDVFKDAIKDAEKTMYTCVQEAVKDDMSIVWDQTNLNRKTRAKKLIMIPDHYIKIAVVFPTPNDIWKRLEQRNRWNHHNGKIIPAHVVQHMINSFEYPLGDEGFDIITVGATEENAHA